MRHAGTATIGRLGESFAARALVLGGARIVARRLRTPWAELDLVLHEAGRVVACEVKSTRADPAVRSSPMDSGDPTHWRPAERMSARQRARLVRAARWLDGRRAVRVDLVEVWISPSTGRVRVARTTDVGGPAAETAGRAPRRPCAILQTDPFGRFRPIA